MYAQTIKDNHSAGFSKVLWLFGSRLSLSLGYFPMWPRLVWSAHENGGRNPGECFDATLNLGRLSIGLTLWRIGGFWQLLKFLPGGRGRAGLSFGRLPLPE